jgi:hypothetical protein
VEHYKNVIFAGALVTATASPCRHLASAVQLAHPGSGSFRPGSAGLGFQKGSLRTAFPVSAHSPCKAADPRTSKVDKKVRQHFNRRMALGGGDDQGPPRGSPLAGFSQTFDLDQMARGPAGIAPVGKARRTHLKYDLS